MHAILGAIGKHGYLFVFVWVALEQSGVPVPALPVLLAAGVLSGMEQLSFGVSVVVAIAACLIGDTIWFTLGRAYGTGVLRTLCKISIEPDTCVRKSSNLFSKHGPAALLLAKFVPGIGTVTIPMAGTSGLSWQKFFLYDTAGAALYVLTFTGIGLALTNSIEKLDYLTEHLGTVGFWFVVLFTAGFILKRVVDRRKLMKELRMSRIPPQDVYQMIQEGKQPYIVDLRHLLDFLPDPRVIPTSVRIDPEELLARSAEIPRDRDVILYCT
jgi:membrane protein DedA with SNARE-associated domain